MTDPTGDRSVSSTVEVAVDPETAFSAFTEELDLWWVRGPINHHAASRLRELRCEPGVGGRLLEIYTDDDALELARITAWEPGKRVAWTSSIDDVLTDVSFEPSNAGTVVTVLARIPADGRLVVADRWFPSSKTCSGCGVVKAKLRLSERTFGCGHCGLVLDRDLNAARNLAALVVGAEGGASAASCVGTLNQPEGNPCQSHTVWAAGTAPGRPAPVGAGQRRRRKARAAWIK